MGKPQHEMVQRLSSIFLLASHLFITGVLSMSILTIENKCNYTVWPVIYSWISHVSTSGFALKQGEERTIHAPSSWSGLISGRTLCSNDSKGNFSCITGDCASHQIQCPGSYPWALVTYLYFKIDHNGVNSHKISLEYGYNIPLMVAPSQRTPTCIPSGCMVDLNKTCPDDLKIFSAEERLVGCSSECKKYATEESCCLRSFMSMQDCKPTVYSQNFERVCPLAYTYTYGVNNSTIICPNTTDYVITFCPSSIPNITRRSWMAQKAEAKDNSQLKLVLGGSAALAVMTIIVVILVILRAKNARRKRESNHKNIEAAIMLKRYSYKKVKKMTNSFAHVLGKGGYGTVYQGKLPDAGGREIAIKILNNNESKGSGEDFINEIASMSRASHVNIVSLFGFCYEGNKRAIIYEFMPNGSLDVFISKNMSTKLDWKMLYNIAVGVARGLEYLHNGCVSRIVHFDIKPQNILMDGDFCPKISDFGMAKLCKNKESIISMLDARGTAGYIAPEVFSNNYGGVSHKSDVYSYGMVVLEMIGATKKEIAETSRSNISTMYFPDWIYEDLEKKEFMRCSGDYLVEEEEKIEKKLTLVGLWCLQTNPSDRPPMRKVIEMLEGSLEAIEVPPKPILYLPAVTSWETVENSEDTSSFFGT